MSYVTLPFAIVIFTDEPAVEPLEAVIYIYMQACTGICMYLPVDACHVYTGRCFSCYSEYQEASTYICFSNCFDSLANSDAL